MNADKGAIALGSILDGTSPPEMIDSLCCTDPRHQVVVDTLRSMRDNGADRFDIAEVNKQLKSSGHDPYVLNELLDISIEDALKDDNASQDKLESLFIDIFDELQAGDIKPDYLIDGLLEKDTTGAIFGESTAGKSFIAIDLACSVATGWQWLNRDVISQGQVIYFAGEGRHGVKRRISAWQKIKSEIPQGRLYLPKTRIEFDLAGARQISHALKKLNIKPVLLVIDTLSRSMPIGSDENSASSIMQFISALDSVREEFQATAVIVHHTGHGEETRNRARGSSAFRAALDFEALVDKRKNQIRWTKMKDAELPPAVSFEFVQVDDSAVIEYGEETTTQPAQRLSRNDELGIKTLQSTCEVEGRKYASLEEWRSEFYRRHTGETQEAKKKAFQRVRESLAEKNLVIVDLDTYKLLTGTSRDKTGQSSDMGRDERDTTLEGVPYVPHIEGIEVEACQ